MIRESEVLVYAVGIDGQADAPTDWTRRPPVQIPWPFPGKPAPSRRGTAGTPARRTGPDPGQGHSRAFSRGDDRVNVQALRAMTDDSGGRTEIVRIEPGSRSRHGQHRGRAEQAVLPRLPGRRAQGRPVARHPSRRETRSISDSCASTWPLTVCARSTVCGLRSTETRLRQAC